jgi:hypothetical protein
MNLENLAFKNFSYLFILKRLMWKYTSRICAIFSETAIHGHSMSVEL